MKKILSLIAGCFFLVSMTANAASINLKWNFSPMLPKTIGMSARSDWTAPDPTGSVYAFGCQGPKGEIMSIQNPYSGFPNPKTLDSFKIREDLTSTRTRLAICTIKTEDALQVYNSGRTVTITITGNPAEPQTLTCSLSLR